MLKQSVILRQVVCIILGETLKLCVLYVILKIYKEYKCECIPKYTNVK